MWSKIFCFTFFVYPISQIIAVPPLEQDSEEQFHFDDYNEQFFGEQACLKRNLLTFTSISVLNNLLRQAYNSPDYQTPSNLVKENEEIQSNFTKIIDIANSTDDTQLEQVLSKSVNDTGNKIAYILLSGIGENLKAKVNKVDEMSKQLSVVLQSRNAALGKRLMEQFNNKVIMAAILKQDRDLFEVITKKMEEIMYEVNRYEDQLYNDVVGTISALKNKVVEEVQRKNISEWSLSTEDLMQSLYRQFRSITIVKDPSQRSKLGQCIVEDAMVKIFNNGHKILFI